MKTRPHSSEDDTISRLCAWCMAGHFLQERIAVLPSRERVTAKFWRMGMKTNINCFYGNMQPTRSITGGKLVDTR